jgi:thioesterase domain-containing protein/acyl carrier protein
MSELTKSEKLAILRRTLMPVRKLSEAQLRLWQLERRSDSRGVHVFAMVWRMLGPVDAAVLTEAVAAVAVRHPNLRVRIAEGASDVPHLEDVPAPRLEVRACAGSPDAELLREAAQPIDPARGPAWRALLFRSGPESHALFLQFHHILADRWSVGVFMGDLGQAYRNLKAGAPAFAASVPLAVARVTEQVESNSEAAGLAWGRQRFAAAQTLRLPGARSGGFPGYQGARLRAHVSPELLQSTKQTAGLSETTLFPFLLAAFAATLHSYTGQEDALVCTPMTGRHRAGTRGVIGYLNNIVPLRLDLSGDPSFAELLRRTAGAARDGYAHQDTPFEAIAGLPELATTRLSVCLLALQNIPGLNPELPGIETEYEDLPNGTANFDLALFFEEKNAGLDILIDRKTAVLDEPATESLVSSFLEVLRMVAIDPGLRLSELPEARGEVSAAPAAHAVPALLPALPPGVEQRMVDIWRSIFSGVPVHADSRFFELGGDSLRAVGLFTEIEREFGHRLPLAALYSADTPLRLAALMGSDAASAPWLSLVPLRSQGSRPPLFCIHGGGGNVLTFRFLTECLNPEQPVYCLQEPDGVEGPFGSVEEMARHYVDAIRGLGRGGPWLLAGHSLGAAIAYEMARILTASGEEVAFLAVLDHPGPHIRMNFQIKLRLHLMNLSMLPTREKFAYIRRGLVWRSNVTLARRRARGPADGAARAPSILERSLRALREYRVQPWDGKLTVVRALQGSPAVRSDPQAGWGGLAGRGLEIHDVPGTHMSMFEKPHVLKLGEALDSCLKRALFTGSAGG